MPIYAKTNLFNGVNPHLNSYLQNTKGKWDGFHALHLNDIFNYLEATLPEGYSCDIEESLQVRSVMPFADDNNTSISPSMADILISGQGRGDNLAVAPTQPIEKMALYEIDTTTTRIDAVMIFQEIRSHLRIPITRLELLSPSNKPNGTHYLQYHTKRYESLKAGINVIEIDYLHQSPPISPDLPSYPKGEVGSFPVWVLVSHPYPTYEKGKKTIYGSVINQELPKFILPLADDDKIIFDLNVAYNKTCLKTRMYRDIIDYAQLPTAFEHYMPDDQQRIQTRLKEIQDTYEIQPPS
jgi:hypothetical protein